MIDNFGEYRDKNIENKNIHVKNKYKETYSYAACFGVALVFGGLFVKDAIAQREDEYRRLSALTIKGFAASELLSGRTEFLGDSKAPFTLVEFGDYECPPCRAIQPELHALLEKYHGQLKFDFRHFPLEMHKNAMHAAVKAELDRQKGIFWKTHDELFTKPIELKIFQYMNGMKGKNINTALNSVYKDMSIAKILGLQGTPSFYLCDKNNNILKISDLRMLEQIIKTI